MKKLLNKIFFALVVSVVLATGWIGLSLKQTLESPLNLPTSEIVYEIKSGSSLSAVIFDLANKNIISHPRYLLWYTRLRGRSGEMKAGDYRLTDTMITQQFLENIFNGKVIQYSLTVIEGWSFKQMLSAIRNHPHIKQTLNNISEQDIMHKLGHGEVHFEGQFLPDTYHFPKGLSDVDFLSRAYDAMQTVLKEEWDNRAVGLSYTKPYEALIMASIVEKETGQPSERDQIAGVFLRRLEKNMRLQTDPTVIYGMGESYKGNVRKTDLLRDTPYNTYRRSGLPPTPIALPGRDAIHAALHPAEGDALYFVSRGDGSHVFSATLQEHNNAVIKYQLNGRVRSFSSYKHNTDESQ